MSSPEASVAPSQVAQIAEALWRQNETEPMRQEGRNGMSSVTSLIKQYEPTLRAYLDQKLEEAFSKDYPRVLAHTSNTRPAGNGLITVSHHVLPPDESCGTQAYNLLSSQPSLPSEDRLLQEWEDDQGKLWSFELTRIRGAGLNYLSGATVACAGEQVVIGL